MDINFRVEAARSGTRIFQNLCRNFPLLLIALVILCLPLLAFAGISPPSNTLCLTWGAKLPMAILSS